MNAFDKTLIAAIKRDSEEHVASHFDLRYVLVKHQDGSEFKITHAKLERVKVKNGKRDFDCVMVFHEHGSHNLFVEADLESIFVKPWKGRKYKLKIKSE